MKLHQVTLTICDNCLHGHITTPGKPKEPCYEQRCAYFMQQPPTQILHPEVHPSSINFTRRDQ